ncbi:MAG: hypothetical protein NVS4B3_18980 [Gemmatimonadaceae bacterium]
MAFQGMNNRRTTNASAAPIAWGGIGVPMALIVFALAAPSKSSAQFSVTPVIVQLDGSRPSDAATVRVTNAGQGPLQFRFYLSDFEQLPNGDHTFIPSGQQANTCAARLHIEPEGAALLPGERQDIRLRMTGGPATCWSIVFAETRAPNARGVVVGQRVGVKVYGVNPSASREGEVSSVVVTSHPERAVTFDFRSGGSAPLRPRGRVEIRRPSGETIASEDIEPFSVLPGRIRRIVVPIRASLPRGQYLAIPVLDLDATYLAGGQAPFGVP